jgi:hypothetical protein
MDNLIIEKIDTYCSKQGDDDFLHGSLTFVKKYFHEIMELRSRIKKTKFHCYFEVYSSFTPSEKMLFFMIDNIDEYYYLETLNKSLMTSILLLQLDELYRIQVQLERNKRITRYILSKPIMMKLLLNRHIYLSPIHKKLKSKNPFSRYYSS